MKILSLLLVLAAFASAEMVNLWPGDAPGAAKPVAGSEKTNERGHLTDIESPQYQLYLPEKDKATGAAVVIFPGGGYGILAMQHEGHAVAKWLNERGIAGIVVKYRVAASDSFGYRFPVPFLDARRAIRTVRANAAEWGIDPKKVGVLGFSAGGHLASLCATRFGDTFAEEGKDAIDQQNVRPDFALLIYPVISMKVLTHGGSRNKLLGEDPSAEQIDLLSTDLAVSAETPPVFLLTTADDGVDCRNSLDFASACKEHKVPVSLHLFETGGHGYGLGGKGDVGTWPTLMEQWLKTQLEK